MMNCFYVSVSDKNICHPQNKNSFFSEQANTIKELKHMNKLLLQHLMIKINRKVNQNLNSNHQ